MSELEIEVSAGSIRAIPVPNPGVTSLLLSGPGELFGWSFRESGSESPLQTEHSITSPGAGATISALLSVPPGDYTVSWQVSLAGTVAAGDANNFELNLGATPFLQSVNAGAVGVYPQEPVQMNLTSSLNITVTAIAAGTVGAIYTVQISMVPAIANQAVAELQDGNSALGEISAQTAGTLTQWMGPRGVRFYNQIKVVPISGLMVGTVYARYGRAHGWT